MNAARDRRAALDGLEVIAILITRYAEVEQTYLSSIGPTSLQLREAMVQLYTSILEYLIELCQYFGRRSFVHFAKAVFEPNVWDDRKQNIKVADAECKELILRCDAYFVATGLSSPRERLDALDARIRQQLSKIFVSRGLDAWDPGLNTDTTHLWLLFGARYGAARALRIAYRGIENDRQLFSLLRSSHAMRQHRLWRQSVQPQVMSLAWLSWYEVKSLDYVKVRIVGGLYLHID